MLGRCVFVCLVCALGAFDEVAGVYRTVDQIIADGFPAETHLVTTSDGYRLEMHRIPHGREAASNAVDRPVVFLMHGLMSSSESFVLLGPDLSFAYNLADAGFDVWMGNARGNTYSRSHVSLNPDSIIQKYSFFDFTFEEIGAIDLPTMMDYALEFTGKQKLHYIGHSQGGTAFLVLGALNSEYMNKITSAHLLAGVGYQEYFPNEQLAAAANNVDTIYTAARLIGIVELYPEFLESLMPRNGYTVADYCTGDVEQRYMCELFGVRHYVRQDSFGGLAGASLKQAAHYGQNIRDKLFRRYHHGSRNNQAAYGQEEPPLYDLSLITVDVTMHYTVNDYLLDERDVLAMAADMPNTKVRKVARETFLHEDFVVASDAKELVTDYIIEELKNKPETDVEYNTPPVGSIEDKIVTDGFPLETHHVTTSDGYILGIHRIPHGRETAGSSTDKPVVFLMHGLMSSSESFVLLGPDHSLAYNLADAGFDVWMGNARGNRYSRSHISLDPDSTIQKYSFFDFTFEEIGAIDLPTMMNYALEFTGKQKLQYIGHSQGGTAFLVLGALKSEYMNKIASAHLLAGVGYQEYFPNEQLAAAAVNVDTIYNAARLMGIVELYPDFLEGLTPRNGYTVADYCTGNVEQNYMCELFGVRHLLRQDSLGSPAGASLKQAAHYGQNIRDKLFRRYHHGATNNEEAYGLEEPPLYDLGLITADVTMHYTVNDNLLDERDVLAMAADMPNTKVRKVARETFSHGDFVVALDAKELVTDYIIEELKNTLDAVEEDNTPPVGSIEDKIVTDGFPLETHHVTTSDGYRLEMHRISHGREADSSTIARPVVFLMHGLMSSSEAFVLLGPDHSVAYNLADSGFDVWMGNARGNRYSRSHASLDPDHNTEKYDFFDFTFEEIGSIDLPTMMDYALEVTGKQKLHYIGHSQGGTAFLVLGAMNSEYMKKIASAHLLAGVGYQEYFPNEPLAAAATNVDTIYNTALRMGIVELYPEFLDGLTPRDHTVADYCTGRVEQRHMCELFGVRHFLRQDNLGSPAGASLKQAAHYGQNIRDKLFRRYHHGTANDQVYGLEDPPLYDLSLITADVTMHYTVNDNLLDERDVLAMAADMPNTKVRKVARETFLHEDFVAAFDAKELVTDYIIEELKNTPDTVEEDNVTPAVVSTPEKIVADGYPAETHHVTTMDGYILEMHRIPYGRQGDSNTVDKPVVFLMHGLMASSYSFVELGPVYSMAYNLADEGFDVWMGNARGNIYSRSHVSLNPDDDIEKFTFFDLTFEEIGLHDLPTMMDYALEVAGKQRLHYIGHSQGGTVFLVLGSLRSEYMIKIASAHLLAGVGYQDHFPNEELQEIANNVDDIYQWALMMGIVELYPNFLDLLPVTNGYNVADYCTGKVEQRYMCELLGIRHLLRDDDEAVVAGAALKQAVHFIQNIRDKQFRRFHHGTEDNQVVYGLEEPPLYDISYITADVTMHYTVNDYLLDERDVLAMAADIPNAKVRKVARETFLHEDFVFAHDAKELVTDYIIEELKNTPDTLDEEENTGIDDVNVIDHTDETDPPGSVTEAPIQTTTPDSAANIVLNAYLILFSLVLIFV